MKKLLLAVITIITLSGCNLGDVNLNPPEFDATYAAMGKNAVLATIDGSLGFYDSALYTCVDGLFYRLPLGPENTGVANTDGSIATCENELYTYIQVANTNIPFIGI